MSEQLHLNTVENVKIIEQLTLNFRNNQFQPSAVQCEVAAALRFFGKNFRKLLGYKNEIIKLANIFLYCQDKKIVKWSLRDSNAFLLVTASLLLKKKEEEVVRQSSLILKEFVSRLTSRDVSILIYSHKKQISLIFHKISKVSTHYSQTKVLDLLHTFLKDHCKVGAEIIQQSQDALYNSNVKEELIRLFNKLDSRDFLKTSREFLEVYNRAMAEPFIFSLDGYLMKLNERKQVRDKKLIKIDFNLRNLSIAFFIDVNIISNDKKGDTTVFVELSDCEVLAKTDRFTNPNHVELMLKPGRSEVLDKNDEIVEDLPSITSLVLVIDDEHKYLMTKIYQYFEERVPMPMDCDGDTDSLMTYRTLDTSFGSIKLNKSTQVSKSSCFEENSICVDSGEDIVKNPPISKNSCFEENSDCVVSGADIVKNPPISKNSCFEENSICEDSGAEIVKNFQMHTKEPRGSKNPLFEEQNLLVVNQESKILPVMKQTATIVPMTAHRLNSQNNLANIKQHVSKPKPDPSLTVYDDMTSDSESLPPVRTYLTHKRLVRSQNKISQPADENIELKIAREVNVEKLKSKKLEKKTDDCSKKTPIKKNVPKRPTRSRKRIQYSTEDEEDKEPFRKRKIIHKNESKAKASNNILDDESEAPLPISSRLRKVPAPKKRIQKAFIPKSNEKVEAENLHKNPKTSTSAINPNLEDTVFNASEFRRSLLPKINTEAEIAVQSPNVFDSIKEWKTKALGVQNLLDTGTKRVPFKDISLSSNIQVESKRDTKDSMKSTEITTLPIPESVSSNSNDQELTKNRSPPKKRVSLNESPQHIKRAGFSEEFEDEVSNASVCHEQISSPAQKLGTKHSLKSLQIATPPIPDSVSSNSNDREPPRKRSPPKKRVSFNESPQYIRRAGFSEEFEDEVSNASKHSLKSTEIATPPISESVSNNSNDRELPRKRSPPKKRVSFNESPQYIKRARFSEEFEDEVLNYSVCHEQISSTAQKIVYNMDALKKSEMLKTYLKDSVMVSQEQINYNDDRFDELIEVRTQTLEERTSPTQIRRISIQEINVGSSPEVSQELIPLRSAAKSLVQTFKQKAAEKIKPLIKEIKDLRASHNSVNTPEMKAKLRRAIVNTREANTNLCVHVDEHVKLLKRVQYSKRKLTQYVDEERESLEALDVVVNAAEQELNNITNDRLKKIENIKKRAVELENEAKTEVWQGFLKGFAKSVGKAVQKHYKI